MVFSRVWQLSALLCVLTVISVDLASERKRSLNEFVTHFEPVYYDSEQLHQYHTRVKRGVSDRVELSFRTNGRLFNLELWPDDRNLFMSEFEIEVGGKTVSADLSHLYAGRVIGDPDSDVFGSLINGTFDGTIRLGSGDVYYVENARRYRDDAEYPSILYHENDLVVDPHQHDDGGQDSGHHHRLKRDTSGPSCGLRTATNGWMLNIQKSAVRNVRSSDVPEPENVHPRFRREANVIEDEDDSVFDRYSAGANRRSKRDTPDQKTCTLFLQTDHVLWEAIYQQEGNKNADMTVAAITSMLSQMVKALNDIFRQVDFKDSDGDVGSGYNFRVLRIKVNKTSDCDTPARNPFCPRNIDVENFLNLNSMQNHNEYCLAYIFTYRDFQKGTLGLAWVAYPDQSTSGGICELNKPFEEYVDGKRIRSSKSLNTGVVTLVNYNTRVAQRISEITFAHEVGHNFGSPHDASRCQPGDKNDGNYIMYASSTPGSRANNDKFSPCSIGNMTRVLRNVVNKVNNKNNCFKGVSSQYCGNGVVEEGEECDCGYMDDCKDQCCYPRGTKPDNLQCKLKEGARCSPSQGPCCTDLCGFRNVSVICAQDADCSKSVLCNGTTAKCPAAAPKPDWTECNGGTQICRNGSCIGSICESKNYTQCFLTADLTDKNTDREKLCDLSCQVNGECKSTYDLMGEFNGGKKLRPGAPCSNYQGYCDVFLRCRQVDADGPLARLKNLLFSNGALATVKDWIVRHWWAVLLIGVGVIIVMAVFIKGCAYYTPSSNPKKRNHHITHIGRRHREQHREQHREHAAAAAAPPQRGRSPGGPSGGAQPSLEMASSHPKQQKKSKQPRSNKGVASHYEATPRY